MLSFCHTIKAQYGLHARIAGDLVQQTKRFQSDIHIRKNERIADAKKLMDIMTLRAKCGDSVEVEFEGPDEQSAMDAIKSFFDRFL